MGSTEPNPVDRRVQRTRRTLRDALIALIYERGWDSVTVQDICDRADVGRSTFYTHFADKEELLVGGFDDLRKALRAQLAHAAAPGEPLRFARGMIEHARDNLRLFRALVGKRSGQVVLRRFQELVTRLVTEDLEKECAPGPRRVAVARFIAGGFMELLSWWLHAKSQLQPEEVEVLFLRMAAPALELARASP